MKILSDNAVTKADLTEIDAKQTRQIQLLQAALAVSFFANASLTLVLKYLA